MIDEVLDERETERVQIALDHDIHPHVTAAGVVQHCPKHGRYVEDDVIDGQCPECHRVYEEMRVQVRARFWWMFTHDRNNAA